MSTDLPTDLPLTPETVEQHWNMLQARLKTIDETKTKQAASIDQAITVLRKRSVLSAAVREEFASTAEYVQGLGQMIENLFAAVEEGIEVNLRLVQMLNALRSVEAPAVGQHEEKSCDPVRLEDGRWYFWDEVWSQRYGPYGSEEEARSELELYCRTYLALEEPARQHEEESE